ncbi:hypothetical protein ACFVWG_23905 [Kribbella sp. NPDC058245]|uniref:hypothetical protein n=1 Tax=Kribbella sp. NPDC058245 TaxID=3346399 RepID=UPI0036E8CD5E
MLATHTPQPTKVFPPVTVVSSDELTAEVRTISPSEAALMLKRHVNNRPLKDRIVAAYARDMKKGRWQLTGEAIKFNTRGELDDGRHRLKALIRADVPVKLLVVCGVPPQAQAVMDSGVKRSANDQVAMAGIKNASILTAAARLALSEPGAGYVTDEQRLTTPTNSEIVSFLEGQPTIHRAAEVARSYYPAIDGQPSVLCIAWLRMSQIDAEDCALFFHSVANMTTDGPGDPRLALARRLQNLRREGTRRNGPMLLGLVYRAWNAWRKGKQLSTLPVAASIPDKLV